MRPQGAPGGSSGDNYATAYLLSCNWSRHFNGKRGGPGLAILEVLGITMRRLAYLVVAAIGISAVNLVLLVWVIMPPFSLEWEGFYSKHKTATLEGGFRWFPVSVNSKNETIYRPSISSGSSGNASRAIDNLRHDNDRLRETLECLDRKARYSGGRYSC